MKQGRASTETGYRKAEPKVEAIDPCAVNQLGNHPGTARAVEPLKAGRGYSAPVGGSEVHTKGSQGRHK